MIFKNFNTILTAVILVISISTISLLGIMTASAEAPTPDLPVITYAKPVPYESLNVQKDTTKTESKLITTSSVTTSTNTNTNTKNTSSSAGTIVIAETQKTEPVTTATVSLAPVETIDATISVETAISAATTENTLTSATITKVASVVSNYSEEELDVLYRIVEAEAGSQDVIGKCLVANVILNRVKHPNFDKTITGVVFASGQFQPTSDGRYYTITVSDSTKEAVQKALAGEDYSQGALFFKAPYANADWSNLKLLFIYGGHEFYTYK